MIDRILNKLKPKSKPNSDDFIKRFRSLIIGEGMLLDGNIELIEFAIKNMPPKGNIVEIGSYGGLSTNLIIHLLQKHQKTHPFFNCDPWIYEGYNDHLQPAELTIDGRTDVLRTTYSAYMKQAYMNSIYFLSAQRMPHTFHATSNEFFEKWHKNVQEVDIFGTTAQLGGAISFAYIDGDHSFSQAYTDFENVANNLMQNGFILLDDSGDRQNFGSSNMMNKIKQDSRFKVVAKNPNYLLQRVK